jgi:hypothetical protein
MYETTKSKLFDIAKAEMVNDPDLAKFLVRLINGNPTVLIIVEDGLVQNVYGLPDGKGMYNLIDLDVENYDSEDDVYAIAESMGVENPRQYGINKAVEEAVSLFGSWRPFTEEEAVKEFEHLTIIIPERDLKDIQRTLKKKVSPANIDLMHRVYHAHWKKIAVEARISNKFEMVWRIMRADENRDLYSITNETKLSLSGQNIEVLVEFIPDPTYEQG